MTSLHPADEEFGYCGNCHDFTGSPIIAAGIDRFFPDLAALHRRTLQLQRALSMGAVTQEEYTRLWHQLGIDIRDTAADPMIRAVIEARLNAGQ